MSIRKALAWQIAVMLALITSVVMARAFAETPWLMLPFVFVWISFSTYVGTTRKLGVGLIRYTDSMPHYILRTSYFHLRKSVGTQQPRSTVARLPSA